MLISLFYSQWWMEVLDSPNFAPAVQNYKQLRKPPPIVGAQTALAQVQSSSLGTSTLCDHLIRLFAYGENPPSPRGEGLAPLAQVQSSSLAKKKTALRRLFFLVDGGS